MDLELQTFVLVGWNHKTGGNLCQQCGACQATQQPSRRLENESYKERGAGHRNRKVIVFDLKFSFFAKKFHSISTVIRRLS